MCKTTDLDDFMASIRKPAPSPSAMPDEYIGSGDIYEYQNESFHKPSPSWIRFTTKTMGIGEGGMSRHVL
ncbi:hypothetical protein HZ326_21816 [Fusarium oxysporum f. sp. albedinis]|nr:hypothetical protein HZ326_21816 [Fusarium oxysporum f. sp. albedinis]